MPQTIQQVIAAVTAEFEITEDQLCDHNRDSRYNHPRHIAVWLCAEFTRASRVEIGRAFDGRSRGTIGKMERRFHNLIDEMAMLYVPVLRIKEALRNQQ